jgi:hypothetical protein
LYPLTDPQAGRAGGLRAMLLVKFERRISRLARIAM